MPSSEVAFIKFIVKPWYEKLHKVIPDVMVSCIELLQGNYQRFKDMALQTLQQKEEEERENQKRQPSLRATEKRSRKSWLIRQDSNAHVENPLDTSLEPLGENEEQEAQNDLDRQISPALLIELPESKE